MKVKTTQEIENALIAYVAKHGSIQDDLFGILATKYNLKFRFEAYQPLIKLLYKRHIFPEAVQIINFNYEVCRQK